MTPSSCMVQFLGSISILVLSQILFLYSHRPNKLEAYQAREDSKEVNRSKKKLSHWLTHIWNWSA